MSAGEDRSPDARSGWLLVLLPVAVFAALAVALFWGLWNKDRLPWLQVRLGGEDFHVLPLSIDRAGLGPVRSFYEEIGIRHLELYLAADLRAMLALGAVGLPTTLLIDREGREIARRVGPAEWDSPEAVAQFESIIARR